MKHYFDVVLGPKGPIALANVSVFVGGTGLSTPASIFSDNGVTSKLNPFQTDSLGNFDFYVADGSYDITFSAGNILFRVEADIQISQGTNAVLTNPSGNQTIATGNLTLMAGGLAATFVASKNVDKVRFVDSVNSYGWTGADAGAWINAALADLPASGGVIEISTGTYACTTAIVINKPCIFRGQGTIGTTTSTYSSFLRGTVLQNLTTASDLITLTIPAGNFLSGVTLRDFAIEGNQFVGSASAGSNIRILGAGPTTVIRDVIIQNVVSLNAFQAGIRISNNAFIIKLYDTVTVNNNGDGVLIDATTGNPSQIYLFGCDSDLNTGAALHISSVGGGNGGDVYVFGGTFSDSLHGFQLDNGSSSTIHAFGAHFEHNNNDGCRIFGSSGHYFSGCFFFGNVTNDFNLSSVGQGFTTCMSNIQGSSFQSAPATANISIAASCNSVILGQQNGIGGGTGYTVVDSGFETQRLDKAIHKFFATQYKINSTQPSIVLNDTSSGTPLKTIVNKSAQLQILNNAGSEIIGITDTAQNFWAEAAATGGAGSFLLWWADSQDHMWKYNQNNAGEQHIGQIYKLTAQYTNSTTGFTTIGTPNFAFPVNANQTYTATVFLFYQAAATGGLNIQFTGPAAPTAVIYGLTLPVSASAFAGDSVATAFGSSLGSAVTTATTNFVAIVNFTLINGVNAGTVTLQAKSSAAAQLQIQIGSYMIVK